MNELELIAKIEKAEQREYNDDHLTTEERQELVNMFLEFYKGSGLILDKFPHDEDMNSQYIWILYDF